MATQDALRMSPEELYARRARGEAVVVVDVRTEDALSVHPYQISGSRWLPLASVVEQAHTLPRHSTIVCY
ncbi:MAG TPA: hypothetical protein VGX03_18265 [Candidatus Binatia bacterium]|nr:hypothetical protein [Candidatus Binatia bacterium]